MDMNILKYMAFIKAVEYGSFTRAAEVLNYSQSGVSRMIHDLEKEWNITLLERNRAGIRLTSDGGPFPPDSPNLGATDLLISYTYRLAGFTGSGGAQYGLAAAMSILIFFIVAGVSVISFRRTAALEDIN